MCTAKIVETVPWIDAKYYASTQVMDEARHVEVFAKYLDTKLSGHYPINAHLKMLLDDIVEDSRWDMTYLGMQIMVEGLALAAFGFMHQMTTEPLLKQLLRYVMSDEARHVAFGVLVAAGVLRRAVRRRDLRAPAVRLRGRGAHARPVPPAGGLGAHGRRPVKEAIELVMPGPAAADVPDDALLQDRAELQEARPARPQRPLAAARFEELGVIQFEDWADTGEEYEAFQLAEGEIAGQQRQPVGEASGAAGRVRRGMSTSSDLRTLVMHGLRLKGFAEAGAVAEAVGVDRVRRRADARRAGRRGPGHLPRRADLGLHAHPGRPRAPRRRWPPSSTSARRPTSGRAMPTAGSSASTAELLVHLHRLAARVEGESVVNDHTDPAYDAEVIERLRGPARRGRADLCRPGRRRSSASPATARASPTPSSGWRPATPTGSPSR